MTGMANGPKRDGLRAAREALAWMPDGPWSVRVTRVLDRDNTTHLIEALVQTGEGTVALSAVEPGGREQLLAEISALLAEPADDEEEEA